MVSQYGIKLAAYLISSSYGDFCSRVCECLLSRGTLTLAQIIRFTELSRENVINCLRVLIHQNCVQAFSIQQEVAFGEAPKIVTQYMALFDNTIHKMRFPKFMQIVSEELGKDWKQDFSDAELSTSGKKKEILWRVNFEEFVRRLRHKACIEYVRIRLSDQAGIVLSAILELTRSSETRLKTDKSASMSINDIYDEVIKKDGGLGMDLERVRVSLVQLGCQIPTTGIDETYSIDLKNIIELAQNEEVESVVLKRYGREAYRIFRLLSKSGRLLETDKVLQILLVLNIFPY
ncbi:RNA polymerase III subunit RPC82 family protein [Abeliophyllum distichum]|uniref:DNA-directed RNA polymerase III subunit RPC3 n=1 Tax=Abeliophyllum distichum TaxID=126358 RepID=A0ABD1VB72_9LAMI